MFRAITWTILIYSFAGHKEWRFIHPILPLLHVFAAKSLVDLSTDTRMSRKKKTTHWNGPIEVMHYIRQLPRHDLNQTTIGFLVPCHSTPGQSHLHRRDLAGERMWQLGCEPPLQHQNLATYKDQTDVFFDNPKEYLLTYFPSQVDPSFPLSPFPSSIPGQPASLPYFSQRFNKSIYPWKHEWPQYLILFGDLLQQDGVQVLLEGQGYGEVWKAGREWEGEGKRKGAVRVWKWASPPQTN
uniref:Mannosyltransferase n=1 Tax=Psilocybe cubensis TaxID=181762 RepID=A0A8H7Y4E3_PSICU